MYVSSRACAEEADSDNITLYSEVSSTREKMLNEESLYWFNVMDGPNASKVNWKNLGMYAAAILLLLATGTITPGSIAHFTVQLYSGTTAVGVAVGTMEVDTLGLADGLREGAIVGFTDGTNDGAVVMAMSANNTP